MTIDRKVTTLIAALAFVASGSAHARAAGYAQSNLVSNIPGLAQFTDPTLLNPWGVAFFLTGPEFSELRNDPRIAQLKVRLNMPPSGR